jgi:hypothetical protein
VPRGPKADRWPIQIRRPDASGRDRRDSLPRLEGAVERTDHTTPHSLTYAVPTPVTVTSPAIEKLLAANGWMEFRGRWSHPAVRLAPHSLQLGKTLTGGFNMEPSCLAELIPVTDPSCRAVRTAGRRPSSKGEGET